MSEKLTEKRAALGRMKFSAAFVWAGGLLGFALGGFFDGILLHQVLQWHHLLSAVEGPAFADIRTQILADGMFHVLMYLLAALGLWLLWKSRRELGAPGASHQIAGNGLIGFGLWHVIDGIVSHWILGIHRIRMDAPNPLFWDLLWFVVFGLAFIAAGWWLRKKSGNGFSGRRGNVVALMLAAVVIAAAPVAALPPANVGTVLVLFKPGTSIADIFRAIDAADGSVLWANAAGDMWAVHLRPSAPSGVFYRHGAYLVSNSPLLVGCLAWTTVRT